VPFQETGSAKNSVSRRGARLRVHAVRAHADRLDDLADGPCLHETSLSPASRALFEKQLAHSDHLRDVGEQLAP
jgi:hypothetical protein